MSLLFFIKFLRKESEVHLAIVAVLPKVRMFFKLKFARMLKNKNTVFGKHIAIEDEVWQLGQCFKCVRWVGKDDVELLVCTFQKVEDI